MSLLFDSALKDDPDAQRQVRQWYDALMSGRYKQGKWRLREEDRYCCLGVLCEVAGVPSRQDGATPTGASTYVYADSNALDGWQAKVLPAGLRAQVHMQTHDGGFREGRGLQTSLAIINDEGAAFKAVAALIRRHFEAVAGRPLTEVEA